MPTFTATHDFDGTEVEFELSYETTPADPDVGIFSPGIEDLGVDHIVIMGTMFKLVGKVDREMSDFIDKNFEQAALDDAALCIYEPDFEDRTDF